MQTDYGADFHREQGFTERDWLRCLPGAVRDCKLDLSEPGLARVQIGDGWLRLRWQVMAPRQIAMVSMPRLAVHYQFDGVAEADRLSFMRFFDLYTMRGGG